MNTLATAGSRRALAAVVWLALAATPVWAADPIYEQLLAEGKTAAVRADWPLATARLHLACFGLLEEPVRLAECLTRLAKVQAAAGDRTGFLATADRLLEVEQRFGAYSAVRLEGALRTELEAALERWVDPERLLGVAAFADLGRRMLERKIAGLPAAERRQAIESRLAAEPANPRWHLLLASLELDNGQPAAALEVPTASPPAASAETACLRGLARAALGSCAEALADLASCAEPASELRTAQATLGCQVRLARWAEAEALYAALPETMREQGEIRRLAREIRKGARTATRNTPEVAIEPAVESTGASTTPPPTNATPPTAEQLQKLGETRRRLARATNQTELDGILLDARRLADAAPAYGEAQHLVAEIAYRTQRWPETIEYFRRGGTAEPVRPELLFYLSVAQYETGQNALAAETLRSCLDRLKKTDFVQSYVTKILGPGR